MATALSPGGHSPTSLSRTLEKVLEDAQQTGEIYLSGRKIKDYSKVTSKYDLSDATSAGMFQVSDPFSLFQTWCLWTVCVSQSPKTQSTPRDI